MGIKKIGVVGAGSWGTALAISLSKAGHFVKIWDIDEAHMDEMIEKRENVKYLSGIILPENLQVEKSLEKTLDDVDLILFSAPAQNFRDALTGAKEYIKRDIIIVNVAKGIEISSLKRLSQVAQEVLGECKYVCLSGPSHAEEVGRGMPTTVVVAGSDTGSVLEVQDTFMNENLRVYTTNDMVGVEIGGALKNIIALGAGISDGMGYGDNTKAAMMTRGLAEITRLGMKMGAKRETFAGLTGIGDLIVTCTSMHSRNRKCGIMIGEGVKPEDAINNVGMVVEGIYTTEAAFKLGKRENVEMPITEGIYAVLKGHKKPDEIVKYLMKRQKKSEEIGEYDVV